MAAEAALERGGVVALEARLRPVALEAERLQLEPLPREGLPHRNHMIDLAGAQRHRRAAQLAQAALLLQMQELLAGCACPRGAPAEERGRPPAPPPPGAAPCRSTPIP